MVSKKKERKPQQNPSISQDIMVDYLTATLWSCESMVGLTQHKWMNCFTEAESS